MVLAAETGGQTSAVPAQITTGFPTGSIVHDAGYPTTVLFFFFFFFDDPRFPELAAARAGPDSMAKNATSSVPKPQHSGGHSRSSASHRPRLIRLPPASRGHYCSFWRNRSQPSTSELNAGTPLRSYGVDSLLAVEMASWILKETQVSLTVLEVFLATMPII